jgi:hypothetical protein
MHAPSPVQVLNEFIVAAKPARRPQFLLDPFGTAEFDARSSLGIAARDATALQIVSVRTEMVPQFLAHLGLEVSSSAECAQE